MKQLIFAGCMLFAFISIAGFVFADEENIQLDPTTVFMPSYVIQEADYRGKIEDAMAFINAKLKIEVLSEHQVSIPILNKEIAIIKTNLPKGVLLIQRGQGYNLFFSGRGSYNIQVQFAAQIKRKDDRNVLRVDINPAAISKLKIVFQGTDLDIRSLPSISTQLKIKGKQTEFTAYLGMSDKIQVDWFAKPTALAKAKLLLFSENNTLVTIVPGLIRTQTFLSYKIVQGKLSRFNVSLPVNLNLLTVKGENLRNWNLKKEKSRQVLELELSKEASDVYQLVLEAEEIRDRLEGAYTVVDILSLNTERENGYFAFVVKDDFKIRAVKRKGVSQLDVGELPEQLKRVAGGENNISLAYRFLRHPKELVVNIEKIKPEIIVRSNIFLEKTEEVMKLLVQADYKITKAGVFNFNLELPADMEVIDVSGPNIENWEVSEGTIQNLEVQLRTKAIGDYTLRVEMEKQTKDLYQDVDMPKVRIFHVDKVTNTIRDVDKITGFIGVSCDSSIRLKTKHRSKLTEVDLNELIFPPKGITRKPILAYKFLVQPYELKLAVEKVDPRMMADIFTFLSVGDGLMLINSAINFDILFAGVDQFSLVLPEDVSAVDITGEGIKSKDESIEEQIVNGKKVKLKVYKIALHSKVKGKYTLYCAYEKASQDISQKTQMPSLGILGVERQTGYIAIGPRANVEIELAKIENASQVDVKELPPDKMSGIDIPIFYAFKYVRYPYAISLNIKKHEDVSVLVAVVESANITTVLGKDGQIIVNALYQIKNRSKQYLDIVLPENAAIWSTFVDGKAVKPAKTEEGRILLPLVKHEEKNRSFPVEIIYETKQPKLFIFGAINLSAPQFDIPLTNVTWNVYLPFGLNYFNISSNLERGRRAFAHKREESRAPSSSQVSVGTKRRRRELKKSRYAGKAKMELMELEKAAPREAYRYDAVADADKEMLFRDEMRAPQKDLNFLSNITSQVARYSQQLAPTQEKQITEGRQKGVLPIHITIPTGGRLFTFSKLINREPLKIHAFYARKFGKAVFILLVIIIIFAFLQREKWLKRMNQLISSAKGNVQANAQIKNDEHEHKG